MKRIIALVAALSMCMTTPVFAATTKKSVYKSTRSKQALASKIKGKKPAKKITGAKKTTQNKDKVSQNVLSLDVTTVTLKDFDNSVSLSWIPIENAQYYKILRGTSKDNIKVIANTKSVSYTDKSISVENNYYYEIIACNGKIESCPSDIVSRGGIPKDILAQVHNGYNSLTSNNDDYYFTATINDSVLTVDGQDLVKDDQWFEVLVIDTANKEIVKKKVKKGSDGKYSVALNVPLNDGSYYLNIFRSKTQDGDFDCIYSYVPLNCKNKKLSLTSSPVYINNYKNINSIDENDLLNANSKYEDEGIVKKVQEITKGIKEPIQKIKAIHDWIADNIYYDFDFEKESIKNYNGYNAIEEKDAANVFKRKKGVCAGFADLFAFMVREVDIPCLVIDGQGISKPSDTAWNNITMANAHAWNMVYLNGKWIIVDVTWDCRNKYENGDFIKGLKNYTYFNPTWEFFSLTHKIINILKD